MLENKMVDVDGKLLTYMACADMNHQLSTAKKRANYLKDDLIGNQFLWLYAQSDVEQWLPGSAGAPAAKPWAAEVIR
jgi:hypothetical protein